MYTIDLSLKRSAMPISVFRKEKDDAIALYQQILSAMKSGTTELIELTCDKEEDKKIALLSDSINAVILSQKSGGASSGRSPGFFNAVKEEQS
jgi:hypothetical protein